ncbi:MAG: leucyl aminopeptidase [Pirellulaceae bacterium]|jgi:leucyl aminopeptidase|nr:leucyl aminopeptidase [Pirellulaceae bacterium]
MNISVTNEPAAEVKADAVVVGHFQDAALSTAAAGINEAAGGALARLIETEDITGKRGELTTLLAPAGTATTTVVVVGLGKQEDLNRGAGLRAAAVAAKSLAKKERVQVAFYLSDGWSSDLVEAAICGAVIGCEGQDLYRAEKELHPFGELLWSATDASTVAAARATASGVSLTRRLVNEPASVIYPDSFAAKAEQVATDCGLEIEVWDKAQLEAERCGALLAVSRGSVREPRLVIMRHNGGPDGQAPLALVGKGVTFDSGGLSLKPSDSMKTMKCDMAGAATVLGAMSVIAQLKLPVNVIGLMGLTENMVNGNSFKLGDVLTARSGKTIEILNTDAEGRLVLADTLDVAVGLGAAKIIDLATLTGACVVALGTDVAGLMSNDQAWCHEVEAASQTCGERSWQLPMFKEFNAQIESKVADIKNIGEGRWGGAITAAKFLEEFVGDTPWTHIDIAGPAFFDSAKPWIDAGGSGAFVRTLVEVARHFNDGSTRIPTR